MKKLARAFLLSIIAVILMTGVALAIDTPTTTSVTSINVYGSVVDTNDQLWLITQQISYGTSPNETADQAFLFRIFADNGTELASTPLINNPYYETGYGQGACSMYFTASEASALGLTWGGNYVTSVEGNPTLTWNPSRPVATMNTTALSWTASGATALGIRVLYLAGIFQSSWGIVATSPLIQSGSLTDNGAIYFEAVIPRLREIAPEIFRTVVIPVEFHEREYNLTYAVTLRNQWVGTWMDLTDLGNDWGIDPIWLYGIMWSYVLVAGSWLLVELASPKYLTTWCVVVISVGTFAGFYSYMVGGIMALVAVLALVNQLFFGKSYA